MKTRINNLGVFLVKRLRLDRPGKGTQELRQELIALSAGSKSVVERYYVRKVLLVLTVLGAGFALALICFFAYSGSSGKTKLTSVLRPGYGEGDRTEALSVQVEGEDEVQELTVTVQERKYTEEEKQALLDLALSELDEQLPGENDSLDFVQTGLVFPESLQDGAVSISWMTDPYGVIGADGNIVLAEEEEGTLVEIQETLECDGRESTYSAYARVFPPDMTEEERLLAAIEEEVVRADEESSHKSELVLPASAEGRMLTWIEASSNPCLSVLAMTLVLAVCLYLQMDNQVHKKAEERKNQLLLDYPDLMWKMTMLLGAGMSIRGAFMRISEEYQREQRQRKAKTGKAGQMRYVYEEITYTCREMQSGIGEAQAYERFGKRCQLPEYIRIGSILSQNLRKGAKGLTDLLETEAEASLNDRKNHARKIGEQAGTKLLLPMMLMLGIVLTVLMVPAFLSF
ncbi:MAG: type II secretion system F family protein [Lachnospiraceae bacterium]|nr:type II secretion system F family protein [Lachnospiraceae bacterium]